jgi:hypothetical protein
MGSTGSGVKRITTMAMGEGEMCWSHGLVFFRGRLTSGTTRVSVQVGFMGAITERYRTSGYTPSPIRRAEACDGETRAGSVGEDFGILRVRLAADLREATFLFFFAWLSTETDPAPCGPPLACRGGDGDSVSANTLNWSMVKKLVIAATLIRNNPIMPRTQIFKQFSDRN